MKTARTKAVHEFVDSLARTRSQNVENSCVDGVTYFSESIIVARKRQTGIVTKSDPVGKRQIVNERTEKVASKIKER
jgi:hypothetical protein